MKEYSSNSNRREHKRYDVALFGELVTPSASVSIKILNLSLGGAMVLLFLPGHPSLFDQVKGLSIIEFGTISCLVTLKRDLKYHLKFDTPFSAESGFSVFLSSVVSHEISNNFE